jgi:branched-chain amino acid aminotransferase
MDAVLNGYDEGIMLSVDGFVSEGSGENIFIVRDGAIITPPDSLSLLPGITRSSIIQLARDHGLQVEEKLIPREALYLADEVFFTGTAAEITPIRSIDKHTIGAGRRGPVTETLQKSYFRILKDGEDPYGWLRPVEVASVQV